MRIRLFVIKRGNTDNEKELEFNARFYYRDKLIEKELHKFAHLPVEREVINL